MKILVLALAALLVLGGAAVLLFSPVPEAGPGPGEDDPPDPTAMLPSPSPSPSPSAASTVGENPSSARPLPAPPRAGGFRPPQPPREDAPPGEILKPDLPEAEAKEVEETRRTLMETDLGRVEWRGRPLRTVAEEIASKSGVPVVLEGEDIADEPVQMGGDAVSARAALDHIAGTRALRFEVQPGKVVIRR